MHYSQREGGAAEREVMMVKKELRFKISNYMEKNAQEQFSGWIKKRESWRQSIINVKKPVIAPGKGTSAVWASQQGRNKSIAQSAYEAQHRIYKY